MATPELGQAIFGNRYENHDAPGWLATDLYELSELLGKRDPDAQSHGVLGGEWGYGQDFDNDVFEMHPYWWGDCECGYEEREWAWCEANDHAADCYQARLDAAIEAEDLRRWDGDRYVGRDLPYDDEQAIKERIYRALTREFGLPMRGCAVHCTCDHGTRWVEWLAENKHAPRCRIVLPNFLHKPSGFAVHWYKYIGRSMTCNRDITRDEWRSITAECRGSL